jgi:AraC family transcriptional regulator
MLLKQFPDINMVRRLSNDAQTPANAWKNVALNIKCREVSRLNVESPYSLFMNRQGFSYCSVNKRQYLVETDTFLLSRPGELYGLVVDNMGQTEIANIHINRDFFNAIAHAYTAPAEKQLDETGWPEATPTLFTQLYKKDEVITQLTNTLLGTENGQDFEIALANIVVYLLSANEAVKRKIIGLPYMKTSVRVDIYKRLAMARDHIYSNYKTAIDLDDVCREIGMSKFHFLRMFKALNGITPYQYLTDVRMQKAEELLKTTEVPVAEISDAVGFEYPNSFTKAFRKAYGKPPLQFRNSNIG